MLLLDGPGKNIRASNICINILEQNCLVTYYWQLKPHTFIICKWRRRYLWTTPYTSHSGCEGSELTKHADKLGHQIMTNSIIYKSYYPILYTVHCNAFLSTPPKSILHYRGVAAVDLKRCKGIPSMRFLCVSRGLIHTLRPQLETWNCIPCL